MAIRNTTKNLYVRLEDDDRLKLEALARDNDRSVAAELRRAVRFYLERQR